MNREKTNIEEQELLRVLRTLASEEEHIATPPRVEGLLMRAFDETRTVRSHHHRLFARHALKAAAVFVLAVLAAYWWSGGGAEAPSEQAPVPDLAVTTPLPSSEALAWLDPEPGSLQIVYVRIASSTLAAQGYAVGDPDGDGLVDLEVIVGDDGLARGVRVAPATAVIY